MTTFACWLLFRATVAEKLAVALLLGAGICGVVFALLLLARDLLG